MRLRCASFVGLSLATVGALATLGCEKPSVPRDGAPSASAGVRARPSAQSAAGANVEPAGPATPPSSTPPASAAAESAQLLPGGPGPRPWPLAPDCADPRLLLAIRYPSDPSRHLWLKQVLGVFPEFSYQGHRASEVAKASASRPSPPSGAIWVYETAYGPKRFAQPRPFEQPDFYRVGLIARCGEIRTCENLAAVYAAVDPRAALEFFCGVPPASSGGEGVIALLEQDGALPERLAALEENSCARIRSCQARLGKPRSECLGHRPEDLRRCATGASCSEIENCAATLQKIDVRPSPVREAQPRSPGSRPRVSPGPVRDDLF